jgi:hypothetical protein
VGVHLISREGKMMPEELRDSVLFGDDLILAFELENETKKKGDLA